jgi:hypothetical protein
MTKDHVMAASDKKKSKGKFLKLLLVILAVLLIITTVSYIYYRISYQDASRYIPDDYLGLIKIESISAAYNNLIDLRAAELFLAEKEIQKVHKALLDFRSRDISKSRLLTSILDMQVELVLTNDIKPVLIIDMGFKSMLIRPFRFISTFLQKNENFFLEEELSDDGNYTIYKITIHQNGQVFYITIHNNLFFFSLDKVELNNLFAANELEQNLYGDASYYYLKKQIRRGGIAEIYFNTNKIAEPVRKKAPLVDSLLDRFALETNSAISMNISNEDLFLSTFTRSSTQDPEITSFFALANPDKLEIVEYLPDNTSLYSAVNFHSFKDFYRLFLYLQNGQYDNTIEKINSACEFAFKMSLDDILFSWVGSEIGACTTNVSGAPVLFLEIDDKAQFEYVLEKLTNNVLLSEESNISFEGVPLNKIVIPDFLKTIIDSFTRKSTLTIDTPYYVRIKDFVFFSMEPAPLANLVNKYNDEQTLVFDKMYRKIAADVEAKANVFLYFNMTETIPVFLQSNDMIPKILKLYEKGAMTINFKKSNLQLDLAAAGINIKKTRLYPGFPRPIDAKPTSRITLANVSGSRMPEFVFTTDNKRLFVTDTSCIELEGFPARLNDNSDHNPLIFDIDNDGIKEIVTITNKGFIHAIESDGLEEEPFPVESKISNTVQPVIFDQSMAVFDNSERALLFINGYKREVFPFQFSSLLLSSPSLYNDLFAFYPKSFSGSIYLTNSEGRVKNGWPAEAGGIGYGSPLITSNLVAFITQSGSLSAWKHSSSLLTNFPVELEGVFYSQPAIGNVSQERGLEFVTISKDGTVSIISSNGELILQSEIISTSSKDFHISIEDVDGSALSEIFIYGGTNNIYAFDSTLTLLPGFPVIGSSEPSFYDLNNDGDIEMVTGSVEKKIYVYSIPQ